MTSNDHDRQALFLTTSNGDGIDGSAVTFDGSEEAMRRLRHPFAVTPAGPTNDTGDDPDHRN
ncbi:hypothetical protein JNW91_01845 [Micromonospora sp. STR1_7]|uniref:Uncharacterized protein n=1 Tax=Micromonospora parastrephiae TaxID=2806101 RepID=A0ABS1XN83_9ACTN|nr:hypothetical protein [Micromonospora parastrephiae]MBM0230732.1 hypothetical protein [Micromonospora parastrephiae]